MESRHLSHNNPFTHMIQTLRAIEPTNLNTRCAYHSNIPGHYQNNCWTLKNKIQDLINDGEIKFNPPETSVVITAPMPSLDGRTFRSLDLLSFACFFSVCLNIQIMTDIICFNNHHQCIAYVCL